MRRMSSSQDALIDSAVDIDAAMMMIAVASHPLLQDMATWMYSGSKQVEV